MPMVTVVEAFYRLIKKKIYVHILQGFKFKMLTIFYKIRKIANYFVLENSLNF